MELVKKLKHTYSKKGVYIGNGIFYCELCKNNVVRSFSAKTQKSCGCKVAKYNGEGKTNIYNVWLHMIHRCYKPKSKYYHNYGGRGIFVCDEWNKSFFNFKKWALSNGYSEKLQIDRRNNDKGYSPENCRFVTHRANNRNKRTTILKWVHVDAIRDLSNSGVSNKYLSELFGVGSPHISKIINFHTWKIV